jgi:hypothetical protein
MHEEAISFTGLIQKHVHTQTGFERNWADLTGNYHKNDVREKSVSTFL